MTAPVDLWRQVADRWAWVHGQIGDGQWDNPTPCAGWTVRDLIDHLQWHVTALGMLDADVGPDEGWESVRTALEALLSDPSRLEGTVDEFGGMPRAGLANFLVGDRLIHTWDLARAIGVDDRLPAEAVEVTLEGLQDVPPELLRGKSPLGLNMMSDAVTVRAGARDLRRGSRAGLLRSSGSLHRADPCGRGAAGPVAGVRDRGVRRRIAVGGPSRRGADAV